MVLYGVTQAILQSDMRRLLSYHIISQVGYMVVAVSLGTAAGLAGGFTHLTAHVLYKGLLFMIAGAILVRTGESSLKRLGGLWRQMPVTFVAFLVAAFAISGVPGFSGFVSKGLIAKATESAGSDLLWWVLVAGSVGTSLSFVKFGYYAFVRAAPEPVSVAPARPSLRAALIVVAVPCVGFGLFPDVLLGAFPGGTDFEPYATSELLKAGSAVLGGVVTFVLFRGPLSRIPSVDVDRLYNPLGAALATVAAASAIRIGETASATIAALSDRTGTFLASDQSVESTLHAALWAVTATAAAVLLLAALATVTS
jgi:multicomponent Na+:H+ antiporter subunit D